MTPVISPNSSNSNRLREVAETDGARAYLLGTAAELDPTWLAGAQRVGVSAGASTPEHLVETLIDRLKALGASDVQTVETSVEDVFFAPPPMRRAEGAALPITVDSLDDDGQNGRDSHPRR